MTTMTTSIKCGNCKGTHDSVAAVKACYAADTTAHAVSTYSEAPVQWATAPVAKAAPVEAPATDKQVAFIGRLREERGLPATATGLGHLTKKQASSMIEELLAMPKPAPAPQAPALKHTPSEGMHRIGDDIFKVQRAVHGSGHLYAKRLVPGEGYGSKARFVYAPGALKNLNESTLMTLTNEESIEAGIGPICAGKWFNA